MASYGIRCPRCDGVFSVVEETRAAPERRRPVIVRIRRCSDCRHQLMTLELLVTGAGRVLLPDALEVLRTLRAARHALARGAMVAANEMAGELVAPGRGTQLG